MPHGTPQKVREHIHELVDLCGTEKGGVMMRGELEAVWPLENIEAMFEAYYQCGLRKRDMQERKPADRSRA